MSRTLLCAIGLSLCFWSGGLAAGQPATSGALSPAQRTHLQAERFDLVTSVRGLPLGVRDLMTKMFGGMSLDIAEPGAAFQKPGAPVNRELPSRRMIAAGCSRDFHCLLYYERFNGNAISPYVMLFRWTPDASQFEWGGTAPGNLATIDNVRSAILSGAIKGHAGPW
jgi:hypothetical protein